MKKLLIPLFLLFTIIVTGCSSEETNGKEKDVIKVGVRSAELKTWEFVKELADKEGLKIEVVNYSSAYNPNESLLAGDIDANAFQHIAYLDQFNERDRNNKGLKKLVEIYQSKETAAFIEKTFKGNYIPTVLSLEELVTYKEAYNKE